MANNKPPKTIGEAVQRLKLFNEKLQTLRGRKFVFMVTSPNNSITWRFSNDAGEYEARAG